MGGNHTSILNFNGGLFKVPLKLEYVRVIVSHIKYTTSPHLKSTPCKRKGTLGCCVCFYKCIHGWTGRWQSNHKNFNSSHLYIHALAIFTCMIFCLKRCDKTSGQLSSNVCLCRKLQWLQHFKCAFQLTSTCQITLQISFTLLFVSSVILK